MKKNERVSPSKISGNGIENQATAVPGRLHSVRRGIGVFFTFFLPVALGCFFMLLERWVFSLWAELDVNEVLYHLNAPLEGTGNGMVGQFVATCLAPALLTAAVLTAVLSLLRTRGKGDKTLLYRVFRVGIPLAGLALFVLAMGIFAKKMHLKQYIKDQLNTSTFIEDHYVDPSKTEITFPEKKRNLIYIYLESMEVTYTDKTAGGAFPDNVIPELTELAAEGEDFSGSSPALNGGRVMPGTTFTMGGIFGTTSGLPLKMEVAGLADKFVADKELFDNNDMSTQQHFFDSVITLGDLLEDEGYRQIFLLGSDATFGGRRLYFSKHGDFTFYDYLYAKEAGWIPQDYGVFWGFEDEKLFSYAKETLKELAASDEPFNLTLLTVDTHFEDGYVCRLCGSEYGDNQYANVFACSSRQVTEFVRWCQQQDFYENTTIVLTGDHTTMDHDFCKDVPGDYVRKTYTLFLNSDALAEDPGRCRDYSTLDLFPTALAALGAQIEGDRLGLGTNLFSNTDTLIEEFGAETCSEEIGRRSEFMQNLSDIDLFSEAYNLNGLVPAATLGVTAIHEDGTADFELTNFQNINEFIDSVEMKLYIGESTGEGEEEILVEKKVLTELPMVQTGDNQYRATASLEGCDPEQLCASASVTTRSGKTYVVYNRKDLLRMITDMDLYLEKITGMMTSGEYTLIITAKDEATAGLTESVKEGLRKLGLKQDLTDQFRCSYLAVISPEGVMEQFSPDQTLQYEGVFPDGVKYWVASGGGNTNDNVGRVWIGTYQWTSLQAVNKRGLNFVLYNHKTSRVADSVCFDTFENKDGKFRCRREE